MSTRPKFALFILLLFTLTLALASPASAATEEILLTEIVVTPTGGEFVEIHNPTTATVDLSDYYLTDATFAPGGAFYYNIVTGILSAAGGGGFADFHARFPDGATILPGEYQTIAMAGSDAFVAEYSVSPNYELYEDGDSADTVPDMREALPGSINGQGGLTNSGEVVVLYFWDGETDLVTDVDYALWGDKDEAVDKTGVSIDGPDVDSDASLYLADTSIASQDVLDSGAHSSGNSWQRDDLAEGTELASGGNGVNGEDETSENLSETWCESEPTPGEASSCPVAPPSLPRIVINEIMQNPAAVNDSDGEWFELYNAETEAVDVNGWTIRDDDFDSHVINNGAPLEIPAFGYLVLGRNGDTSTNGGVTVDYEYVSNWALGNSADEIVLLDGNEFEVDRVEYDDGFTFPDPNGASMALTDSTLDNNVGANWCVSGPSFGDGDLGTPGAANECAPPPPEEACGDPITPIFDIQGNGLASPLDGNLVSTEGVVVGDFQDGDGDQFDTDLGGFFIQDAAGDGDPATSDGIFVFAPGAMDVNVGDKVRVAGEVDERFDQTAITDVSALLSCGTGGSVAPTGVTLPVTSIDDLEAYEGMLVTFPQQLYISEFFNFDRFNEIVLTTDRQFQPTALFDPGSSEAAEEATSNALSRITLDDGRTVQNPDPARHPNGGIFDLDNRFRGGDTVQGVTGVLNYDFGLYRIQPTAGADYTSQNPRPVQPKDVGGNITVAAFNVLNYFNTLDDGVNDICGPQQDQECRGADNEEERTRQLDKIVSAMATMKADVLGIIEVENTTGVEAMADIVDGLNGMFGAGTYAYVDTGTIGTDVIKVGFIYKTSTVTPVGAYEVLDTPEFVDPNNTGEDRNRPALAQTFYAENLGGTFTAVVNHFKSKSGSELDDDGGICVDEDPSNDIPDCDQGDGQAYFNATRTAAAQELARWLADDFTGSDDDFLIIGDLNSYDNEDPIDVLKDNGYADLLFENEGEFAYSYVFDGQLGYLDYGMANQELLPEVTGVTVWHINTDEPDILDYDTSFKQDAQDDLYEPNAYRSSDHDPVIVGLDMCEDTIAPTLNVSVTPDMLWPPDHEYVTVDATVEVEDDVDASPTVTLVSVTSNEPDNGEDDGDTIDDIVIVDDFTFNLRAERSGIGTGRIYTITYEATDACGNSTIETATVTVPLSLEGGGGRGRQNNPNR